MQSEYNVLLSCQVVLAASPSRTSTASPTPSKLPAATLYEAIAMASITRHWSTFLNGTLTDEATFRRETDQAIANVRKKMQVASSR